MTTPWEDPLDASTRFNLSSLVGSTVIIAVGGVHPAWQTSRRITPAVRCNIVALNGDSAGQEFADVLIFNSKPVRQLRGSIGKAILAHVVMDPTSMAGALALESVEGEMREYATQWNATYPGRVEGMIKAAMEAFEVEEARLKAAPPQGPSQTQPWVPTQQWQAPRQAPPAPPSAPPPLPPAPPSNLDNPPF